MNILNLIWDVDGTLFDTHPAITYAFSRTLNRMGYSISLNAIDRLVRQSLEQTVIALSQRFKLDPELLRNQYAESYREIAPVNQPPFPGVLEVCQFIHHKHGCNVIVTHRDVRSTHQLLVVHGLEDYFETIFSVEHGYPRKPDPTMVLVALEQCNLNPDNTICVGDREIDIQTGQAAGIRTCLFGNAELTKPADLSVEDYRQLLDLLIQ